jgi:hypothetical protein
MSMMTRRMPARGTELEKVWVTSWSAAAPTAASVMTAARARRVRNGSSRLLSTDGGRKGYRRAKNEGPEGPSCDSPKSVADYFFFAVFFAAFFAAFFLAAIRFTTFHAVRDLPVAHSWHHAPARAG